MSDAPRQAHLNLFILASGHHEAAWRHPSSTPERMFDPDFYTDLARTAEAAAFDAVFLADIPKLDDNIEFNSAGRLDPLVTLATIAAATERIGLIGTASTTYSHPWQPARSLASLDHLSRGRAAWNIVTTDSPAAARNFGLGRQPGRRHSLRACRGVRRRGAEALGQPGGRRDPARPRLGSLPRPVAHPPPRRTHPARAGGGCAHDAASAPGLPGARPGRLVQPRRGYACAVRRGRSFTAQQTDRGRPGVLRATSRGRAAARPRPRPREDPAGAEPRHRRDGGGGAAPAGRSSTSHRPGVRPGARTRTSRTSTSTTSTSTSGSRRRRSPAPAT